MTKIFLKNPIYRHHYLSIFIILGGLVCVGLSTKNSNTISSNEVITGIFLTLGGQFFASLQFVFEEVLIKKKNISSYKIMGYEGLNGSIICGFFLLIFQFTDCKVNVEVKNFAFWVCNQTSDGDWKIEDIVSASKKLVNDIYLLLCVILMFIAYSTMVYSGICISYYSTSASRAVSDSLRSILVWIFFLLPFNGDHKEKFISLQLVGFLIIILGNLLYNEIITIPLFKLDYYTRKKMEKRKINVYFNKLVFQNDEENTNTY
jgi:hypothetical protein